MEWTDSHETREFYHAGCEADVKPRRATQQRTILLRWRAMSKIPARPGRRVP